MSWQLEYLKRAYGLWASGPAYVPQPGKGSDFVCNCLMQAVQSNREEFLSYELRDWVRGQIGFNSTATLYLTRQTRDLTLTFNSPEVIAFRQNLWDQMMARFTENQGEEHEH